MECLREQGVDTIFGYPGGQIMPLYNALYDYQDEIRHVLTCHEQGASHAADGYARSTGKTGVCFATSGPGATNTVTGIATAYMDSVPMVVITGQVPVSQIGKDSFQEVDITGITIPITKHNFFVNDIKDLASCFRQAFEIASSGRPGPVLIDVPKNIQTELAEYHPVTIEHKQPLFIYDDVKIKELAGLINRSSRPVIFAGGGIVIARAAEELTALAEKAHIPVVNTLMGLGTIPRTHELSLGMVGMHGEKEANLAVHNSDLILALGTRFSDRVTGDVSRFARDATIVQVDIDESEIDKNIHAHISIVGDVKEVLRRLLPDIDKTERKYWLSKVDGYKIVKNIDENEFIADNIMRVLHDEMGDDTFIVTEVGQHQMWTAQKWPFMKPGKFLTSGGLGTMGYGLGAAIGAQIGNPDKQVLHIAGDGSFRMNFNELVSVAAYDLPITTVIMKNNTLGMVRQWQKLFFDKRYSQTDLFDIIDYEKLTEAFGLKAYLVYDIDSLAKAVKAAKKREKGTLIVCEINVDDNVFPMVPPGEAINNLVTSADLL